MKNTTRRSKHEIWILPSGEKTNKQKQYEYHADEDQDHDQDQYQEENVDEDDQDNYEWHREKGPPLDTMDI